jgi:hypothetical protein
MNRKIKTFDCVAESRQWREAASARLNAMSAEEELAHLHALCERVRSQLRGKQATSSGALVLREETPAYGKKKR